MLEQFANNAITTLNGGINNSTSTVVVTSAALFPSAGQFRILIDNELMLVTGVAGTTFTVSRGIESTFATSHTSGVPIALVLTKASFLKFIGDKVGTINVMSDYGAVGDGSTDDTTSLQAAFAAGGGKTIVFPPGTYKLNGNLLTVANYTKIVGLGSAKIVQYGSNIESFTLANDYCTITNIEVDNNSGTGGEGIGITGNYNLVDNCVVHDSVSHGIGIGTVGVAIATFNKIRHCRVYNNAGVGLCLFQGSDSILDGNYTYNNSLEGITVDILSYRCIVINNQVYSNCQGGGAGNISLDQSDQTIVANNQIYSAGHSCPGIITNNNIGATSYLVINGNIIFSNAGGGIYLRNNSGLAPQNCVVSGNLLRNNTGFAIKLDSGVNNNVVVGNNTNGIGVSNSGTGNTVANNV